MEVIINLVITHLEVFVPSNEALRKMIRTKHLETERPTLYNLIVSTLLSHDNYLCL